MPLPKPPTEWMAPWVRAWRRCDRWINRSGLWCWMTTHRYNVHQDQTVIHRAGQKVRRRYFLKLCERCGHRAQETRWESDYSQTEWCEERKVESDEPIPVWMGWKGWK